MSESKNGGLGQYGTEPFEQLQFATAGVEGVKLQWVNVEKQRNCQNGVLQCYVSVNINLWNVNIHHWTTHPNIILTCCIKQ